MMKTKVTIQQAISDIEKIFGFTENSQYHEVGKGSFIIDKQKFERYEVIEKLQEYFADKVIDGGGCWISPITFVFTQIEIADYERLNELCKK